MRTFYAKSRASGTCKECGTQINKGDSAWWSQKSGWQCTNCNGSTDQPKQEPEQPEPKQAESNEIPQPRITETGDRVEIEFDRMLDAAQSGKAFGTGNLSNVGTFDARLKSLENHKFFNRKSFDGLTRMIESGNRNLTATVERMREEISNDIAVPETTKRKVRRGRETGDEIEVDRYLDRIPEMWNRIEADKAPANRVVVTVNAAVASSETQDNLAYRAAAAIALADALTERGASVEVRLVFCAAGSTDAVREMVATVVVKTSDQPMSIADLATACCDIGAVRLAMVYGTMRHLKGESRSGLGIPISIPEDRQVGDFIIDRGISNRTLAVEWVKNAISQFQQN